MTIWAIVPVKPFTLAKSRLASIFTPQQRTDLGRWLLTRTLDVLAQVPEIARTLVVSRDSAALAMARKRKVYTVTESGVPNLNAALERATEVARSFSAHAILVLPTDLPQLAAHDVQQILKARHGEAGVVIAPDRHERGTNALFVNPPGHMAYSFGEGSFQRHLCYAREAGLQPRIVRSAGLSCDLDTPDDWALLQTAPTMLQAA